MMDVVGIVRSWRPQSEYRQGQVTSHDATEGRKGRDGEVRVSLGREEVVRRCRRRFVRSSRASRSQSPFSIFIYPPARLRST